MEVIALRNAWRAAKWVAPPLWNGLGRWGLFLTVNTGEAVMGGVALGALTGVKSAIEYGGLKLPWGAVTKLAPYAVFKAYNGVARRTGGGRMPFTQHWMPADISVDTGPRVGAYA